MHGSGPNPTDPSGASSGGPGPHRIELPYGARPYEVTIADREVDVVLPARLPPPRPLADLIEEALAAPIGCTWPPAHLPPSPRVTIIVSDPTRDEPRDAFVTALRRRLPPDARVTIAVATGTHGPCDLSALRLSPAAVADATIVNHDGHHPDFDRATGKFVDAGTASSGTTRTQATIDRATGTSSSGTTRTQATVDRATGTSSSGTTRTQATVDRATGKPVDDAGTSSSGTTRTQTTVDRSVVTTTLDHNTGKPVDDAATFVELGTTRRGTPVRVHRCVVDADLVIATGCIRPHYFAGFGAGCKAIFPGLGEATAIRINHRLKTQTGARAGIVDGNPCREDLEEAVSLLPAPTFLLDGVVGPDHLVHHVVAGDIRLAFRAGADRARPWFTVRARPAKLVIASDALPVTASLYQAAKIAAAVAPLVEPGGTLALVAECAAGVEPLETVNEAIFRIGVLPRLPPDTRLLLVSSLPTSVARTTLLEPAPSVEHILAAHPGERAVIVPRASQLLCEAAS